MRISAVTKLPFLDFSNRIALPRISAIYFVVSEKEIKYVGMSVNIHDRFRIHHRLENFKSLVNPIIYWLVTRRDMLYKTEARFIRKYDPILNQRFSRRKALTFNSATGKQEFTACIEVFESTYRTIKARALKDKVSLPQAADKMMAVI